MYGLSNTATAVIKITDVNDNPPEFTAEMVRSAPRFSSRKGFGLLSIRTQASFLFPRLLLPAQRLQSRADTSSQPCVERYSPSEC